MSLKQMQILDGAVAVKPEPVAWLLTDKNINSLQVDSIQRLIDRLKHAHHTDLCVRINGQDEWFQADWLKHMVRVTPSQPEQNPMSDEMLQAITDPENQPSQYGTVTLDYHFEKIKKWEDLFERMSNKVLQQPKQEPVAWMHPDGRIWTFGRGFDKSTFTIPLYTTPPQPEQGPVALPEKMYEFVPTPEPSKWHHPECEGECIACLIERVVQEAYGSQGLGYLQRHLTSPPQRKPLTHEQRLDLITEFEKHRMKWDDIGILIDLVEAAHDIKENT